MYYQFDSRLNMPAILFDDDRLVVGKNEYDYNDLTQIRIDHAVPLLRDTDMPISLVAASVGYQDYFYFAKVFKKVTGRTPSSYRKDAELSPEEQKIESLCGGDAGMSETGVSDAVRSDTAGWKQKGKRQEGRSAALSDEPCGPQGRKEKP